MILFSVLRIDLLIFHWEFLYPFPSMTLVFNFFIVVALSGFEIKVILALEGFFHFLCVAMGWVWENWLKIDVNYFFRVDRIKKKTTCVFLYWAIWSLIQSQYSLSFYSTFLHLYSSVWVSYVCVCAESF